MPKPNKIAVKAFGRVWGPIADSLSEAEYADSGFDAGEWSGPWHAAHMLNRYEATLAYVAQRFGMTPEQLDTDIRELENTWLERHMGSMTEPLCSECEAYDRKHNQTCRLHPDYDPTPDCIFHGSSPCSCGDKRLVFD